MDATGPFNSISGTLMSIPFCIALTLMHGTPSMKRMTTYNDLAVNGIVDRITLISDASVPVLSAVIEVDAADGRKLRREQRMTARDYSYDRARVSELVRRVGKEENVPEKAFDLVEGFVDRLPARLRTGGDRAYYDLRADVITMPPVGQFETHAAWAATLAHEAGHYAVPRIMPHDRAERRISANQPCGSSA